MFPRRIPIKWDKGHMVWFRQLTSSLTCHGNSIEYYFASLSLNWSHVTASDNTELYVILNRKFQFNANSYGMILAEEEPDAYPRSEKKSLEFRLWPLVLPTCLVYKCHVFLQMVRLVQAAWEFVWSNITRRYDICSGPLNKMQIPLYALNVRSES